MLLSELYKGQPDIEITSLVLDSRKAIKGSLFFCVDGYETDGHRFACKAVDNGAVAVVHTKDIEKRPGVAYIKVADINAELNRTADLFYGHPSRTMTRFGATGTNGKSTLTSVIRDVYGHKEPCGYMGTIAVKYGDTTLIPSLTTPDQIETNQHLADMVRAGMKACAMEISSQGLDRYRVDIIDYDCVIFTNLTHDHLDYHKTMENYFNAKKRLFTMVKPSAVAVLNADDIATYDRLKKACACRTVSYGTDRGQSLIDENGNPVEGSHSPVKSPETVDYFGKDITLGTDGTDFTLCYQSREYPVHTNLVALYNVYNLLGAVAAMNECGMPIEDQIPYLAHIPQVEGRAEKVDMGQDFTVLVDYAHTPDGYTKILDYAKEAAGNGGRILAVFGCPGKRDHVKRPVMGRIAAEYADRIFLTLQDPRGEDPEQIASEIAKGIRPVGTPYEFVPDRAEAIRKAVFTAQKGDVVVMMGKGNESYLYYEEGRRPWMTDKVAAEKALRERLGK